MKEQISLFITFINNPGFVIRIALILERRGFALQSVRITDETPGMSALELQGQGDSTKKDQIIKQIEKLVDVKSVKDLGVTAIAEIKERKEIITLE